MVARWHAPRRYIISYHISYNVISYRIISFHIISYIISYHIIPYHVYHITSHHIIHHIINILTLYEIMTKLSHCCQTVKILNRNPRNAGIKEICIDPVICVTLRLELYPFSISRSKQPWCARSEKVYKTRFWQYCNVSSEDFYGNFVVISTVQYLWHTCLTTPSPKLWYFNLNRKRIMNIVKYYLSAWNPILLPC